MLFATNSIRYLLKQNSKTFFVRHCGTKSTTSDDGNQNQSEESVRVRFAPSPTGYLHLGGLRTALYNYLFAKANNGKFIVRIEDTDQKRTVPDAQEVIFRNLEWAGIIPDESVLHGGNFGPYVQSKRLQIYQKQVKHLLENGTAYYCFCSEKRLETLRKEAIQNKQMPKYDNRCRHLTPVQVAEKIANNDPICIRFKLDPDAVTDFDDIIFGKVNVDISEEGDPIIIKSDGFPTYHFASVVDDHFMNISHVLRGIEWKDSTPKHLLMYQAFGWEPPKFAHVSLLLNPDGTKLSKRHDHANVEFYKEKRIFPLALVNFITAYGGGFQRETGEKPRIYSMDELIETFDLSKLNRSSSRIQTDFLDECNRLELVRHIQDPVLCDGIVKQVQELIKRTYPIEIDNLDLDDQHIRNVLRWSVDRIQSLQQLVEGNLSFLWILPKIQDDNVQPEWIEKLVTALENNEFDKTHLKDLLREFVKENGLKFPKFMTSLRLLLGGIKNGPGVAEMMEQIGRTSTIKRIKRQTNQESSTKKKGT